jgi:DNA-binding MarR family transcriptional regulator
MSMKNPAADPADEVVEQLEGLLFAFRGEMHRAVREAELPISPMELRVLLHIAHHPGCTAGDLGRHSGRDKGQLTRLIQHLEEQGLLRREAHAQDRRAQCLFATEAGEALHARMRERRRALARSLLGGLDGQEQAQLSTLLGKLRAGLRTA